MYNIYINTYKMFLKYITTILKREAINLKENKETYMGEIGSRKEKRKMTEF